MTTRTTDDEVDRNRQPTNSNVDGWNANVKRLATKRSSNNNTTPLPEPVKREVSTMAKPGGTHRFRQRSVLAWCHSLVMVNTSSCCAIIVSDIAVDLFVTDRALCNPNDYPFQWPFFRTLFLFTFVRVSTWRRLGRHSCSLKIAFRTLRAGGRSQQFNVRSWSSENDNMAV